MKSPSAAISFLFGPRLGAQESIFLGAGEPLLI